MCLFINYQYFPMIIRGSIECNNWTLTKTNNPKISLIKFDLFNMYIENILHINDTDESYTKYI